MERSGKRLFDGRKAMPHPFRKAPQLPLRGTVMYHFQPILPVSSLIAQQNRSAAVNDVCSGVTLADTQGSSDLLWDDDAAEIVDPPHNSGCFHAVLPPIYGSSVVMVVVFTVNRK